MLKKQRAARELKLDAKTVRKYWNMTDEEYISYFLETKERTKIMDPYREYVLSRLKTYPEITSAIIFDNLKEDFENFLPSYRSVRLYVCNLRESEGISSPLKIRQYGENPELPFGVQAQVDLGQKTMRDANGKSVRVYVFAMVLSSSRYKFVCFQLEPFTAHTFISAHDKAFKYFGGRPAEIVYDQDRVMVVNENSGDIIYTEAFDNYKNYAGFSIHLCRGRDPESKGKIEAVVKYVKNNFMSCRVFHEIARLNSDGLSWLDRTGNGIIHETTKLIPAVIFKEEQKYLKSVPELSEPLSVPKTAIVRKNNIVMYKQNRYCMPKGTYTPGKKVRIETDEIAGIVKFFDLKSNTIIEEYPISLGVGKCIRNGHPERDRFANYEELKERAILGFDKDETAKAFVENIISTKPRYVRDQLSIIVKLQAEYKIEELKSAISYCFERNLFSAVDLRDTVRFFNEKNETPQIKKITIPIKYSIVVAQKRSLETYANLFPMGGDS